MSEPGVALVDHEDDLARARAREVGRRREPLDDRVDRSLQEEERTGDERGDHDEADEAAPRSATLRLLGGWSWS